MRRLRNRTMCVIAVIAPMTLTGCLTAAQPDPDIITQADGIHSEAVSFFSNLASKQAPDCGFAANAAAYDHLSQLADKLRSHIAAKNGSAVMLTATDALAKTITDSKTSHQLASARTDDPNGLCMAPGAIVLNSDAISRASDAISNTQKTNGGK